MSTSFVVLSKKIIFFTLFNFYFLKFRYSFLKWHGNFQQNRKKNNCGTLLNDKRKIKHNESNFFTYYEF